MALESHAVSCLFIHLVMFSLRVYGLLINDRNEILVSDEYRYGHAFTKFPGGGIEFGEGIRDALVREFEEELGIRIEVEDFFYFSDFPQVSAFDSSKQLHVFYYFVSYPDLDSLPVETEYVPLTADGEKRRWISISTLEAKAFTFPADQHVAQLLIARNKVRLHHKETK